MLVTGTMEYLLKPKEAAMLELQLPDAFEELPSPRVLNSHLPFNMLPRDIKDKNLKILFVQRNPKDVAVSLYNHSIKMTIKSFQENFTQFVRNFPTSPGTNIYRSVLLPRQLDLEIVSLIEVEAEIMIF